MPCGLLKSLSYNGRRVYRQNTTCSVTQIHTCLQKNPNPILEPPAAPSTDIYNNRTTAM